MNLDGSNYRVLAATGCREGVAGFHATDTYVYYGCVREQRIGRMNVDGTNSIQNFAAGAGDYPYAITSDANWLYIASSGDDIRRAPIDGGPLDPSFRISPNADDRGIAVDASHIYWTRTGQQRVARANLDGSAVNYNWLDTSSVTSGAPWGVTVDGSHVYWMTAGGGNIGSADLDGLNATSLVTGISASGQNHQLEILGGTAKTPLGAALTNTVAPVISGSVEIGQTLTADTGTWSATPAEVYYRWQVSADSGTTWTLAPGAGATTASYTIVVADKTKLVRVQVRAGAAGGLLTYGSSDPTIAVPPPPAPINTTAPAITANGIVQSVTRGSWTNPIAGDPTYTYQWQTSPTGLDGSWVSATGSGNATAVYVALAADAGGYLRACVTASNGSDATECTVGSAAPVPTAPLSRFFQKTKSVLGDGSAPVTYDNQSGVWGFSSNGTRTVYAGWTNLYSAPAGGGSATSLASYGFGSQSGVLIDSQYVYFPLGGAIQRMDIDGSNRLTSFIPGVNTTFNLARDRNYLYWTQDGNIARAPIGGGTPSMFITGVEALGVAVSGDYIYWTHSSGGTIGRADIGGTGANNAWATTNFSDVYGIGVDRNGVYVEARGGCGGPAIITLDGLASACVATINDDSYAISLVPDPSDAGALPVNAGGADAPTMSGTSRTGNTLTVSAGSWTNTPASYTYRWLVSDDGSTGWSVASGVTGTTDAYLVPDAYAGKYLQARVIAHNGSTWSDAAYTDSVWVPAPPANTVVPAVTGTVRVGVSLSADSGTWTYPPTDASGYVYEWQVSTNGTDWAAALGDGGDSSEYDVDLTDDNQFLRVKVTATNDGGSTIAYSDATSLVDILAPTSSAEPQVTGTIEIGRTLTASSGTWDYATDYAYAWQSSADGSTWETAPGEGAASSTYTVAAADAGRYLRVGVTGSNRNGSLLASSASSARVPSPVSSVVDTPPAVVPVVFSPAPGITVGETRGEAVLAAAVPAAGADLLRGANIWVRPSSKVEYMADALPAGLKLVNGKLVASKPGTYQVKVKVKRANGTTVTRKIKIKVG
jgi:hypothetical protein